MLLWDPETQQYLVRCTAGDVCGAVAAAGWIWEQSRQSTADDDAAARFPGPTCRQDAEFLAHPAPSFALQPDATPSYGKDTLEDFFRRAIKEGLKVGAA